MHWSLMSSYDRAVNGEKEAILLATENPASSIRPFKQKTAPVEGGFWIVCRELVLKLGMAFNSSLVALYTA